MTLMCQKVDMHTWAGVAVGGRQWQMGFKLEGEQWHSSGSLVCFFAFTLQHALYICCWTRLSG